MSSDKRPWPASAEIDPFTLLDVAGQISEMQDGLATGLRAVTLLSERQVERNGEDSVSGMTQAILHALDACEAAVTNLELHPVLARRQLQIAEGREALCREQAAKVGGER